MIHNEQKFTMREPVVMVEGRDVVKTYGGLRAVNGVTFQVSPGSCFGFLGPNGAGKTTLVKMIYCFTPPSGGMLKVLGLDVTTGAREIKARLGVVPQEDNLDPELTVRQNLLVYASYYDLPHREAVRRTNELLDFAGLAQRADMPVVDLSGGQKRRLTIARSLVNKPEMVLLDEPTTGLDPQARVLVWQRLRRLIDEGVTLILTTHYMEEAERICDQLVVMESGRILEQGSPSVLIQRHISPEVVEITAGSATEFVLAKLQPHLKGYLSLGDCLYLYPLTSGRELGEQVASLGIGGRLLIRPATLEDVFLNLAGRGLED